MFLWYNVLIWWYQGLLDVKLFYIDNYEIKNFRDI